MKKILLGLFALSCVSMAAETNLYFRAGADLGGKFDIIQENDPIDPDFNEKDADDFAWELAIEATKEFYPNLELGLGIAYQHHGNPKSHLYMDSDYTVNYEVPGYTSIPLYLIAKYNFNAINNFIPYIKTNIGYSFNNDNGNLKLDDSEDGKDEINFKMKDGLYCGIGAGLEYNNFTIDAMYQLNKAKGEIETNDPDNIKDDFNYSRFTLSFGYKFNLDF